MLRARYIVLALLLPLGGCQYNNYVYETPNDEPWSVPAKGTVVELTQALTFSPGSSRVYIQDGIVSNRSGITEYRPWCQFYLYESQDDMKHSRSIEPDRFTVTRSSQNVGLVEAAPLELAAVGIGVGAGYGTSYMYARDDAGPQPLTTTMRLSSDKQPQVHELICSVSDDMRRANFVSINKIKATLGDIAILHPPATQ